MLPVLLFLLELNTGDLMAQERRDSDLFLTLQRHDSLFFERGFNLCDTNYLKQALDSEFVFYHDQSGIENKDQLIRSTIKYLCSDPNNKPIRKVRKESLEVYALYDHGKLYGAVQSGIHDFYLRSPNKPDVQTGTARFTHVYLLENGNWILKEALSFEHK